MQRVPTLSKANWHSQLEAKVRVYSTNYRIVFLVKIARYYLLARREKSWGMEGLQKTFDLLCPLNAEDNDRETLESYLDQGSIADLVEEQVLLKRSLLLDIVTRESRQSCCFTAGYTRWTGSDNFHSLFVAQI